MTNEERARVDYYSLKEMADRIEDIRIDLYSHNIIDDPDDKSKLDDMLFSIQSKLRYDVKDIIECYEILE
jgi:DNA-binding TFAR19-related protein (PDSD5 family)